MIKLVIFDLDGTLTDSLKSIQYCTNKTLEKFGYAPFPLEPYRYFVGDGVAELIKRALQAAGDKNLVNLGAAMEFYNEIFKEHCMYEVKPYKGILELIQSLKDKGIRIAVNSNKPQAGTSDVVETVFGKETFSMAVGQAPERDRKPSPDGIYHIARTLNVSLRDILYVGDTSTDMQTGKNAGVFTIGVLWGFRDRQELIENKADAIISDPLEILDYLTLDNKVKRNK